MQCLQGLDHKQPTKQEIVVEMYEGVLESLGKHVSVLWYDEVIELESDSSALESEVKRPMFDAIEKDAKRWGENTQETYASEMISQYQRKGCCNNLKMRCIKNG